MSPVPIMAEALAARDVDLGDERAVIDALAREFPVTVVHANLEEAIERARELRAGAIEVMLS